MAIKSTIYKASVQVADMDHHYYAGHQLVLARHPSETDERMMIRLVALAFQAHQLQTICQGDGKLAFGAGLSDPDEPDVVLTDFIEQKRLWVEVGQPEEKPIARACKLADQVVIYCYSHPAEVWWNGIRNKVSRFDNLSVWRVPSAIAQNLSQMAQRAMQLQANIHEGVLSLSDGEHHFDIECVKLL